MDNEYLQVIREGIRAHDQGPQILCRLHDQFSDYDYRRRREQDAAEHITQRLRAMRTMRDETRRTIAAQYAAEARLDRLLRRSGQAPAAPQALTCAGPTDEETEAAVHNTATYIIADYYRQGGGAHQETRQYNALGRFRALLRNIESLPDRFPRPVCERISRQVMIRINW